MRRRELLETSMEDSSMNHGLALVHSEADAPIRLPNLNKNPPYLFSGGVS